MKIIPILFLTLFMALPGKAQKNDSLYIFSYFIGNGEDGLHLACSEDGLSWKTLNGAQSLLKPGVGKDKLMRDPCIIQTPDGIFHMVWTVSWGEKGIGYAWSGDLHQWSEQQYIPVMEHESEAMNCWAPEIFFDEEAGEFIIFWSTTIPGRFPETDKSGDKNYNHRMYYVSSRDMVRFSETSLLYDPGFNSIDGTIIKDGDTYYMFLKDETRHPEAKKTILFTSASSPLGPWSPASQAIYDKDWAEGPSIARVGDRWIVYFDRYTKHKYGAMTSTDLEQWQDISDQVSFPKGIRHGTVLKVSKKDLGTILNKNLKQ